MPEELGETIKNLSEVHETVWGDLKIFSGEWVDHSIVSPNIYVSVAWSGWGKVSAARASTRILGCNYKGKKIDMILFTGVAGAANSDLNQWDIIIPNELIQHDMDARPLFKKYIIPAINKEKIIVSNRWVEWAKISISEDLNKCDLLNYGKIKTGLVATGDKFISGGSVLENLKIDLPELDAVEMEGAAVAQVASQEDKPFLILRVISDNADGNAAENFSDFLENYKKYSWNLIKCLLSKLYLSPLFK